MLFDNSESVSGLPVTLTLERGEPMTEQPKEPQAETEVEVERKLLAEADDKATRRVAKLRQDIVTVARRGELAHVRRS